MIAYKAHSTKRILHELNYHAVHNYVHETMKWTELKQCIVKYVVRIYHVRFAVFLKKSPSLLPHIFIDKTKNVI